MFSSGAWKTSRASPKPRTFSRRSNRTLLSGALEQVEKEASIGAKLAADEVLLQNSSLRSDFSGISLRPGMLSDEPAGQVELGKTKTSRGNVSRASVADTIVSLLENQNVESSWLDLLDGDHDVNVSVERIASAGLDAAEGEGN
ncbi:hypothetical protein BFJ63_vAg30 [Fusarium oxysporum f. sp. narcissi]|uniref:NAD(P)-binding domain-containing protein n=1 Tax=Fusarium oxysporum f. sp. narcissi TaxID=451672 RepID=A0A4Q2WBX3_FUSOX|nr:hypothetical protein BFJ63_vAg30 [Fusarium oxysporum f. sp. narcissi]